MGMFNQIKAASNMLKGMDPEQMKQLMEQAKESQKMLDEQIRKVVEEEIRNRGLVSREEVERMIRDSK